LSLTESGDYSQSFQSDSGCDSLVFLTLDVNPSYFVQDTVTICFGSDYTFHDGHSAKNITEGLTRLSALSTNWGCDSTFETTVEIVSINTNVSQSGTTLEAEAIEVEYQWVDCNVGNQFISGETSNSFVPTSSGSYAVVVSSNQCESTSTCYPVIITSAGKDIAPTPFTAFPNPAHENISIRFPQSFKKATVALVNPLGQLLAEEDLNIANLYDFRVDNAPSGTYILRITIDGKTWNSTHIIIR
jgi:hypothetical protein